jgi:hypothetical protein
VTILAWAAALLAAVGYGAASVLQGVGARRTTGPAVLAQPVYVVGLCADGLAWLASLAAVRVLPLFVVQSVLAASVAVTVVLCAVFLHAPLRHRDLGAVALLVLALAVLAVAFLPGAATPSTALTAWVLAVGGAAIAATAALYSRGGSLTLAALAGLAFAGTAVAARVVDLSGGPAAVAGQALAWAIPVLGVTGTMAYARSLERGPTGSATAVLWSVETVVAGLAGVVLAGDTVRPGWAGVAGSAVVVTLAACVVLATGPGEDVRGQVRAAR